MNTSVVCVYLLWTNPPESSESIISQFVPTDLLTPSNSSSQQPLSTDALAGEGSATGVGVAGGDGPVDVDEQTRVGGLVGAGEGEQAGAGGAGAAGDADLGAREVELGAVLGAGAVQADLLEADEVLAVGDAPGDRDGDARLAWRGGVSPLLLPSIILYFLRGKGNVPLLAQEMDELVMVGWSP